MLYIDRNHKEGRVERKEGWREGKGGREGRREGGREGGRKGRESPD